MTRMGDRIKLLRSASRKRRKDFIPGGLRSDLFIRAAMVMKIPTQGWIPTLILFIHIIQLVSPFPVQGKLVRSYLPFMLLIMPCRCLLLGSQSREKKDERESLVSGSWFLVPDGLVHAVGCRCQGGIRTDLHILFFGQEVTHHRRKNGQTSSERISILVR